MNNVHGYKYLVVRCLPYCNSQHIRTENLCDIVENLLYLLPKMFVSISNGVVQLTAVNPTSTGYNVLCLSLLR